MSSIDVPKTLGALLIGAFFASFLAGGVSFQTLLYYKMYPTDATDIKTLVFTIWLLDACHTGLIWGSLWEYFILYYGEKEMIGYIPTALGLSITFTGVLTFLVQSFFAHRIFLLSRRNWFLVVPLVSLAFLRLVSAASTTGTMLHYRSFVEFRESVQWLFTLGLSLSSAVDIITTGSLTILLQKSKTEAGSLDGVIDSLILYTFETGSVTCAATIVSMICWIAIPTQFVFMALHFVIGKFYANSLLVTLNTRRGLRQAKSKGSFPGGGHGARATFALDNRRNRSASVGSNIATDIEGMKNNVAEQTASSIQLQINVERSVQYTTDAFVDLSRGYARGTGARVSYSQ